MRQLRWGREVFSHFLKGGAEIFGNVKQRTNHNMCCAAKSRKYVVTHLCALPFEQMEKHLTFNSPFVCKLFLFAFFSGENSKKAENTSTSFLAAMKARKKNFAQYFSELSKRHASLVPGHFASAEAGTINHNCIIFLPSRLQISVGLHISGTHLSHSATA